ncbi:2-hydroxyhepta-2,4-diene-1,7-dioate isomerase [Shouchella clausii]|nr:2-hydroxyhepta-2,4-diene-1,7-dioate isomerase [Shouchella clausii]
MKLCTLEHNHLGVERNGQIANIYEALQAHPAAGVPATMDELINQPESLPALEAYIQTLEQTGPFIHAMESCTFGPAIPNPEKIICVGLNYRRHADETGSPYPETPILFSKFNNTLTGHGSNIVVPPVTQALDYEVELAVVIGKTAKQVAKDDALDYVLGYCTANDLSARDLQMKTAQWLLGKTCDGFCPIGPYLVTREEIADPQNLALETRVNGEIKQQSNTADMIFTCAEIISYVSRHFTLKPGDIVLTGTPEGVILGLPEAERRYLQPGDSVSVHIEQLGTLTNKLVKAE